ncbi:MAG: VWA domain-containing protein [Gammaproteobacteria bacterium]|nr:VWA domain-containing protein [Gammaproteobacteria bacterium]
MNRFIAIVLMLMVGNVFAKSSTRVTPLLIKGKQTLYQRVLSIPQARMFPVAKDDGAGKDVIPFTAFYVYGRKNVSKREWLKLGTDRHGTIAGWMPSSRTMEWNQGLTVAFRDPVGGERSLLFRDRESLKNLLNANDKEAYNAIYLEAQAGLSSTESPVVAIQPDAHLDIKDDFYLVPIHKYEDVFVGAEQARMLQVSSVPLEYEGPDMSAPVQTKSKKKSNYSAGLVFAIDSTLSMDKYIDRTREAVGKIFNSLDQAKLLGNVNFGLVSFRDDTNAAPGIGYLSRTYVKLSEGQDSHGFLSRVDKLSATTVSSKDFVEDAYAGVKRAIEDMDWSNHQARYIVLITDAGARGETDPLSSTGMTAEGLRQLAMDNGVSIFVLHLLTPATEANHASADDQYRRLSDIPGIGSLYYGVPTGDVVEFGYVLDALAAQITGQVRSAVDNWPVENEEVDAVPAQEVASKQTTPQLAEFQEKVAKLGYVLRMRYLKTSESGKVPNVFNAWILDRDFNDPERKVLDIRVLLTRDQLSDLHDILRQILNTAEEGLLSPDNFLNELKSLAATISRDPSKLGTTTAVTAGKGNSLADLGFMREYIEDLPYTADAMKLSLQDWQSWSAREQIKFLNSLESKINYYRALHDHTDLWVSLDGGPVDGDSVFPIALDMLP